MTVPPGDTNASRGANPKAINPLDDPVAVGVNAVGVGDVTLVAVGGKGMILVMVIVAAIVGLAIGNGVIVLVFVGVGRLTIGVFVVVGVKVFFGVGVKVLVIVGLGVTVRVQVGVARKGGFTVGVAERCALVGVVEMLAIEFASLDTFTRLVNNITSTRTKQMAMTAIAKIADLLRTIRWILIRLRRSDRMFFIIDCITFKLIG